MIKWLIAVGILFQSCSLFEDNVDLPSYSIGVMLPYSGEYASDWDNSLDWAVENINLAGGVAGRMIKLAKRDIAKGDISKIADEMIADPEIKAVIGPLLSSQVFEIAPKFITGKKVLIAPVASAADISKAFSGYNFFWRLTEPDISQTKTLLLLAQKGGARKVGLITEESPYGSSFEDWFGYFSTELGLEVSGIDVIKLGDTLACQNSWNEIVNNHPDAVIAALSQPSQTTALARSFRKNGQQIRLLFSDGACLPSLITRLGSLSENLEGVSFSSDPTSGFDVSYKVRYGKYPGSDLSNMYDAVTLIGLSLELSKGEGNEILADALKKVVAGRDGKVGWQRDEISRAISMIKSGTFPNLYGASGSLNFDQLNFSDVVSSTYGHWRVDAKQFVVTDYYTSDGAGRISSTSAAYQVVSEKRQQFIENGTWPIFQPRKGVFALLMATSAGWSNYRHQADILHTYQLLKSRGLDDDHIILILADDLATSSSNVLKGIVRNDVGGENLYHDLKIDYKLNDISAASISNIFNGIKTAQSPIVFNTTSNDNIFMLTAGHGTPSGMVLEGNNGQILEPLYWKEIFEGLYANKKYRQIFWANESCYSGKIGEVIATPGVMLMTGANATETSKAWIYDSEQKTWLADKFAFSINNTIAGIPDILFSDLYERCYSYVNGSHVSFYNYQNFGNIHQLKLSEFTKP